MWNLLAERLKVVGYLPNWFNISLLQGGKTNPLRFSRPCLGNVKVSLRSERLRLEFDMGQRSKGLNMGLNRVIVQ